MSPGGRPLIGRARELGDVGAGLARARDGRGELFVVTGEPGIGKTRLLEAADALGREAGFEVSWGRCWDEGCAPAFWPWLPLIDALGLAPPRDLARSSDADEARLALFERVRSRLARRAEDRPVLLLLDDLHAADRGTLLLLTYLARSVHQARIVVLTAHREVDARLRQPDAELLPSIVRAGVWLPLRSLTAAEVRALAEQLGVPLGAADLDDVVEVTGGRPLFVDHALRSLERAAPTAVPRSMGAVFRERLGLVGPATRELVGLLAVAEVATAETLARAADLPATEVQTRLAPALAAGLVRGEIGAELAIAHALVREAILDGLDPAARVDHHARLSAALAPLAARATEVARHALAARAQLGADAAAAAVVRAAEHHRSALSWESTVALCDEALSSLEAELSPPSLTDLLLARGRALLAAGRHADGKASCLRAAAVSRGSGQVAGVARAGLALGAEYRPGVIDPDLVALLRECHAALGTEGVLGVQVLARLAAALQPAPDPSVPVAMAREAVSRSTGFAAPDRRAVLFAALSALADRGDVEERIALQSELLVDATDRFTALRTHARLVMDHMEAGAVLAADLHVAMYAALVEDVGLPRLLWPLRGLFAMRALFDGRFDEVDAIHEELRDLAARADDRAADLVVLGQRFFRLVRGGRAAEALPLLDRVAPSVTGGIAIPAMRSIAAVALGDEALVRTQVRTLQALDPPLEDPVVARLVAAAYAIAGRPDEIERLRRTLAPAARGLVSYGLITMVVDGSTRGLVQRLDAALGTAPRPTPAASPDVAIEVEGDFVRVTTRSGHALLKRTRGQEILRRLVAEPGREAHVLTLMDADPGAASGSLDALDARAVADYRARIEDLRDQVAEAEGFGDFARAERRQAELDALVTEISRAVGLGGRLRGVGSDAERARISVQRHVRKAIRAIGEQLPDLERYLDRCVITGAYCRFDPL